MSTSEAGRMPPASDGEGLQRWHNERGMPWGQQFLGPEPKLMGRMSRAVMSNITVHLANEHLVDPAADPPEAHHVRHMLAHLYGWFRPGQEHYHESPPS